MSDTVPTSLGFLETAEPFVLFADPAHQVGVDALEEGTQRGAVERTVILHPASHDRVDKSCELGKGMASPEMNPPPADLATDLIQGIGADRGQEPGLFQDRLVM